MAPLKPAVLAVLALALSAGCAKPAPIVWNKAGASQADFARDQYECERDAEMVGGGQAARMQLPMAYYIQSLPRFKTSKRLRNLLNTPVHPVSVP